MGNLLINNVNNIEDKNAKLFLKNFLKFYLQNGFQSLSKKDIDLLLFYLMEEHQVFKGKDNYQKAKQLKITPSKLKSLQLESYMRWGKQTQEEILIKLFSRVFSEENINIIAKEQSFKLENGLIPIVIENPVERLELNRLLKENHSIMEYNLNKEVVDIQLNSLILISYFTNHNKKSLLEELNKFSEDNSLKILVTKKDLKDLKFEDFRKIINEVGYESISHIGKDVLTSIIKFMGVL